MLVVLGALASFVSLSSTVPQILRTAEDRSTDGVSWSGHFMALSASVLWAVYAAAVADRVLLAYNALAVALLVVLAAVLLAAEGRGRPAALLAATPVLAVAGVAAAVASVSPVALALAATALSSVRLWPQARVAASRAPLWGLDPWATALGWTGWLLWAVYGLAVGDSAVAVSSLAGLALQSVVVAFRLPPRRTLHSIASGRLGPVVAQVAAPVSGRFPFHADDFTLVA